MTARKMLIPVGRGKFFSWITCICLSFSLFTWKHEKGMKWLFPSCLKSPFWECSHYAREMVTTILFHSVLILKTYWRFSMCKIELFECVTRWKIEDLPIQQPGKKLMVKIRETTFSLQFVWLGSECGLKVNFGIPCQSLPYSLPSFL